MPLTSPDITCTITPDGTCAGMTFEDTTGQYDAVTNPLAWGLPGGPTSNQVTSFTITLVNESTSTELLFSFTVVTGTITAATLTIDSTVTNILASLASTTFPFASANPFELFDDYGADTPEMEDGIYRVYYNVIGTSGGDDFDYTVQDSVLADCEICCCITKLFQSIDPDCACSDKTWLKAMRAYSYMKAAQFTTEAGGNVDRAVANMEMAGNICDGTNCGCGD